MVTQGPLALTMTCIGTALAAHSNSPSSWWSPPALAHTSGASPPRTPAP